MKIQETECHTIDLTAISAIAAESRCDITFISYTIGTSTAYIQNAFIESVLAKMYDFF